MYSSKYFFLQRYWTLRTQFYYYIKFDDVFMNGKWIPYSK